MYYPFPQENQTYPPTVPPTPDESEPRALTLEEQNSFLEALCNEPLKVAFIMDMVTGLRKGELLALTWDDIDLNKGELSVRKTLIRVKNWEEGRYYLKIQDAPKTKSGLFYSLKAACL